MLGEDFGPRLFLCRANGKGVALVMSGGALLVVREDRASAREGTQQRAYTAAIYRR